MPVRHFCLIAMRVRAKYSQFGSVPSPLVFLFCLHEETKTTMRHLLLGGNKNINFCSTCMFDVCSAHISYDWIRILTNNFTEFYSETSYLAQNHSYRNDLSKERKYLKRTNENSNPKRGKTWVTSSCLVLVLYVRGIEWSHSIKKCSQNLAFARVARKNYTGARLLVLAKFLKLLARSHSR